MKGMDKEKNTDQIVVSGEDEVVKDTVDRTNDSPDEKFLAVLDGMTKNISGSRRYRIASLVIVAISLFSIVFLIGFVSFHVLSALKEEDPPLVGMEIRALNRIETLFVEIPITYRMEDSNITEIIATTGYGVFTVDMAQAVIEETDKYIDIAIAPPELTTVDIYANQNQVLARIEAVGIASGFKQLINGNDYSDGFTFVAERNVALKEELHRLLESEEYAFLHQQAANQAVSVITSFVSSLDTYPGKRDVRIHFE